MPANENLAPITVKMDTAVITQLDEIARRTYRNRSGAVKVAIEEYIANYTPPAKNGQKQAIK